MRRPSASRAHAAILVGIAIHGARGLRTSVAATGSSAAFVEASSGWPPRHLVAPAFATLAVRQPSTSTVSTGLFPSGWNDGLHMGFAAKPGHPLNAQPNGDGSSLNHQPASDDPDQRSLDDAGTRSNKQGRVITPRATQNCRIFSPRGAAGGGERGATDLGDVDGAVHVTSPQGPEPKLVMRMVEGLYGPDGRPGHILIPVDWASRIQRLRVLPGLPQMVYARTNGEDGVDVSIAILDTTDTQDRRTLFMLTQMRGASHVLSALAFRSIRDKAYMLMEPVQLDLTLARRNADAGVATFDSLRKRRPVTVPVARSLPALLDLLYAAVELERGGFVHAFMEEEHVFFIWGRALVCGLSLMCTVDAGDEFGCGPYGDLPETSYGSALRTAPEMVDGWPTGASNTVWAVGLMFGTLCLGDTPTHEVVWKACGGEAAANALDRAGAGRATIRNIIRDRFRVEDHSRFSRLDYDVQQLVAGMLDPDPTQRWGARGALTYAAAIAAARGIRRSPPRRPTQMPAGWTTLRR